MTAKIKQTLLPWKEYTYPSSSAKKIGEELARSCEMACFIFAGGVASRLGLFGPKGCFPISLLQGKSLFQILFERMAAFERYFSTRVHIAVMLSSSNEAATRAFFHQHKYFSLDPAQVTFLVQADLPYLDEEKKAFFDKTLLAPNGNGGAIEVLKRSGWLSFLQEKKVPMVHFIPIDNPLLDPLNPYLTGVVAKKQWDIGIEAVYRKKQDKHFGCLVNKGGELCIVDYMELFPYDKDPLVYRSFPLINTGHYCIQLPWLLHTIREVNLPLHWVQKKMLFAGKEKKVWKGELFFFDLFSFSEKKGALCMKKSRCFSPLKEKKDIARVQRDLYCRDRSFFSKLIGERLGKEPLELAADFFYLSKEEIIKWKERKRSYQGYIQLKK